MAEAQNSPTSGSAPAGGPLPVGSTTAGAIAVAAAADSTVATRMSAPPSFDVAD
ncbi:Fe-S cluster assembly protein SufD, partial [Streptomyces sp. TRM76130]|nr:Fe-S cluster assembly protein SufD [Streptomyces sp. TRM76130]